MISVKITFYDDSTIETMPVSQGSFALLNPLTYPGNARVNGETIIALYSEMKAQNTIMSMPSMFTEIEAEFLTTGKQVGGFFELMFLVAGTEIFEISMLLVQGNHTSRTAWEVQFGSIGIHFRKPTLFHL